MMTYKHVTEVVRNICVIHQAIATSVEALIIWIIKQTNANIASKKNKLNK